MVTRIDTATKQSLGLGPDDTPAFAGVIVAGEPYVQPSLESLGFAYDSGSFTPIPMIGGAPAPSTGSEAPTGHFTRLGATVYISFSVPFNRGDNEGLFAIEGLPFAAARDSFGTCLFTNGVSGCGIVPAAWKGERKLVAAIQPTATEGTMSNFDHSKIAANTDITIYGNMIYQLKIGGNL